MKKLIISICAFLSFTLAAQPLDTTDFEASAPRITINISQPDNIWQIGTPSKTNFTSAYQSLRAIATDTVNPYPDSNFSQFTYGFELYGSTPFIEFTHKFDTDSNHAGGYIEMSADNGNTWLLLTDTTWRDLYIGVFGFSCNNFYSFNDSLPNNKVGFTGSSSGWIKSRISFQCMALKAPPSESTEQVQYPFFLRFTFESDSLNSSKDGWMIDNIVLSNYGGCSSLDEHPISIASIWPNPITSNRFTIKWSDDHYLQNGIIKVYNNAGVLVIQQTEVYGYSYEVQSELPEGAYSVIVEENKQPIAMAKLLVD